MLTDALDEGLIKSNPAASPSGRRKRGGGASPAAAARPFTEAELGAILDVAGRDRDFATHFLCLARARGFGRAMRRAGVSGHVLYDLRHTFISQLLMKGAPITYVAAQAGHSNPTTTLKWSAHWLPTEGSSYVDALDRPEATWHHFGPTEPKSGAPEQASEEKSVDLLSFSGADGRDQAGDLLTGR